MFISKPTININTYNTSPSWNATLNTNLPLRYLLKEKNDIWMRNVSRLIHVYIYIYAYIWMYIYMYICISREIHYSAWLPSLTWNPTHNIWPDLSASPRKANLIFRVCGRCRYTFSFHCQSNAMAKCPGWVYMWKQVRCQTQICMWPEKNTGTLQGTTKTMSRHWPNISICIRIYIYIYISIIQMGSPVSGWLPRGRLGKWCALKPLYCSHTHTNTKKQQGSWSLQCWMWQEKNMSIIQAPRKHIPTLTEYKYVHTYIYIYKYIYIYISII